MARAPNQARARLIRASGRVLRQAESRCRAAGGEVAEVVRASFAAEHRDGRHLGNHTVCRRLGFLVERLGLDAADLPATCRAARSAGYAASGQLA